MRRQSVLLLLAVFIMVLTYVADNEVTAEPAPCHHGRDNDKNDKPKDKKEKDDDKKDKSDEDKDKKDKPKDKKKKKEDLKKAEAEIAEGVKKLMKKLFS